MWKRLKYTVVRSKLQGQAGPENGDIYSLLLKDGDEWKYYCYMY